MKTSLLSFVFLSLLHIIITTNVYGQGCTCATATALTMTAASSATSSACTASTRYTAGTCANSTASSCDATTSDGQMWFSFTTGATTTTAGFNFAPDGGGGSPDMAGVDINIYTGSCAGTLLSSQCSGSATFSTTNLTVAPSTTYYVQITDNDATTDGQAIKMCGWTYSPNPCILASASWPTAGCVTDITPNKTWGTDGNCDGVNDVFVDWCGATAVGLGCSTVGTSDIICTSGNSASSFWGEFTYNSTATSDYGEMLGFKVQGVGNSGDAVYSQVYDKATGCPLGGCNLNGGANYEMDLTSYGLTDGTNYYLRVWSSQGSGTASLTGANISCGLTDTYNDVFDDAAPICTHTTGGTFSTHVTTNGNTIGTATSGSTDCFLDNANGGGFSDINCAGQNVVTNDSWFKTCTGNTGGNLTIATTNFACQGTGIQFWMFADGTGGANNNNLSGNDFCNTDGVWSEGSSAEFSNKLICVSPASSNTSTTVAVSANTCYYFLTDGYSGAYCEYDLTASCSGCILLPSATCWSETTGPSISSIIASHISSTVYTVNMSEPIRCCEINATDFIVTTNGTCPAAALPVPTVTAASGVDCQFDPCGSYTSQVQVTLSQAPPVGYNDCWFITPSTTANFIDMCMNPTPKTGSAQILPVNLIYFKGIYNKTENRNLLYWATASERENDFFTVEKSINGIDFEILDNVKGAGNSVIEIEYALFDNNPHQGINYYRLSQTDLNGLKKYVGGTLAINIFGDFSVESVYYNSSLNQLNIKTVGDSHKNKMYNVAIYNMLGQKIYSDNIELMQNGITNIQTDYLTNGIYFVQISDENNKFNYLSKIPVLLTK